VAGVGIINSTDNKAAASALVDFMLSQTAQRYYTEDTYEIPVLDGAEPPQGMPAADELTVPGLNVKQFEELKDARRLLTDAGILM
jgi:iron(III) transport system substrate-binding protein